MPKGRGGTLRLSKGFAQPTTLDVWRTFASVYAVAIALMASIAGVMALELAVTGTLSPGVVANDPGGLVQVVEPGGFAWRSGIRPGQAVVAVSAVDEPGGWSIETRDAAGSHRAAADAATVTLRQSWPLAAIASVLGVLALVAVPIRRRRAELLAALGLACASVPLWLAEDAIPSILSGIGAAASLQIWILRWVDRRSTAVLLPGAFTIVLVGAWAFVRLVDSGVAADLDGPRLLGTIALAIGVLALAADLTPDRLAQSAATLRILDGAAGLGILAIASALAIAFATPPPLVVAIVGALVLAYVALRTGITRLLDRALLAEVRERAALQATEQERARLSRELHDDPLQVLAGVIRRLEQQPETEDERATLRTVAEHLRDVATELHPPVLDDLGLVPAIESLPTPEAGIDLRISVLHHGYELAERPGADVEIALYRIVQEAVANAIEHSGCRTIRVDGEVGHDHVTLEVSDDGRGMTGGEVEAAMRRGHIGVASMRRRADAIDARLTHRSTPGNGTIVGIRWQA